MSLRSNLIKLAHQDKALRPHLLPLLKSAGSSTRFETKYEVIHGYWWGLTSTIKSHDGGPEETTALGPEKYAEIELGYRLLLRAQKDPVVAAAFEQYLRGYDHLTLLWGGNLTVPTGIAIQHRSTVNADLLEQSGWVKGGGFLSRIIYTHPGTQWEVLIGHQEKFIGFSWKPARKTEF